MGGPVLRVLQDFESTGAPLKVRQSGIAAEASSDTPFGHSCLKITISKEFQWVKPGGAGRPDAPLEAVCVGTLSGPYLPPEADAIRMRIKGIAGAAILAVGSPVSQLGNSDVFCDPQLVRAEPGAWQTLEFSLNQRVARNFRRPNFTGELPVVYYTRWVQEPVYLYLVAPPPALRSACETVLLVDQIELIGKGEGRPFPRYDAASVKTVAKIADFEAAADLTNVFSLAHGYSFLPSFEAGYRRTPAAGKGEMPEYVARSSPFIKEEGLRYPAPRYTRIDLAGGGHALQAECVWAEEGQIVLMKARGSAPANALAFTVKPDFPKTAGGSYEGEYGGRRINAIDVVVLVAPEGRAFPWHGLAATDELMAAFLQSGYKGPGARFDYMLTTDPNKNVNCPDIRQAGAFGFYGARRYAPVRDWSPQVIPLSDFICVYGQGECKPMQARQQPLRPETIAAVGFLVPFGAGHGTLDLDEIALVHVPETPHSFWQVPDMASVKLTPLPRFNHYRMWQMMTLEGSGPAFLE